MVWIDRITNRDSRWRWAADGEDRQHDDSGATKPRGYLGESIYHLAMSADTSAAEVQQADASGLLLAAMGSDGKTVATDGGPEPGGDSADRSVPEIPEERADTLFQAALYWATELPTVTVSPSLKPDDGERTAGRVAPDGTILPKDAPSRWRYIGTAQYGELSGYIRESATVSTRDGDTLRGLPPPEVSKP